MTPLGGALIPWSCNRRRPKPRRARDNILEMISGGPVARILDMPDYLAYVRKSATGYFSQALALDAGPSNELTTRTF